MEDLEVYQPARPAPDPRPGAAAHAAGRTLYSCRLGALPILNRLLRRMRLEESLRRYSPPEDRRFKISPATGLVVLLKNLLLSREPLYSIGEWATRYAPDVLGLSAVPSSCWNDDRAGRCLDRLFQSDIPSLVLAVTTHVVREFRVELDELHNDSTTVTFHGAYADATEGESRRGRPTLAITWGHNKDHRPDLKQLLFILTVAKDGGVPVQFRVESGNVVDDLTHRATWDLLCQLTGRRDFLYVADCKLATAENMAHLHQHGGQFVSVLPRTRAEDGAFRASLSKGQVRWRPIHEKRDDQGEVVDRYSVCEPATSSVEGYRLVWYHSTRKAELDACARHQQVERALGELAELRRKLSSPRTRHRDRAKVSEAVDAILEARGVTRWIVVEIVERTVEKYRQERPGRPNEETRYVRAVSTRFDLTYRIDHVQLAAETCGDGIFPLITNVLALSELELLLAYKRQPVIETRFAQLKTDFAVAPVYLNEVSRIQALLCVYYFALLTEALLERELRQAMSRAEIESLPLYPEDRPCRCPTARRLIDLFDDVQRHTLVVGEEPTVVFTTKLTRLQRKLLGLLGIPNAYDG